MRFNVSASLLAAVMLVAPVTSSADVMEIVDLSTNPKPKDFMKPYNMDVVTLDKKVYFTDFYIDFVTRGEWVAGGAGFNKDVSAVLRASLVGVTDTTMQEIIDEAFAYTQQKFAEIYTVIPDAEADAVLMSFEKIAEKISATKPEDLRVDTPYLKVFSSKKFAPGNKVRISPTGAASMGAYKAWYNAAKKLEATSISFSNRVEFGQIGSGIGQNNHGEKQATVSLQPNLFMVGGGTGYSNSKIKAGMIQNGKFAGFPDTSWVKETRKVGPETFEVVADPVLYKAAALKMIKAHIDAHIAVVKAELADD